MPKAFDIATCDKSTTIVSFKTRMTPKTKNNQRGKKEREREQSLETVKFQVIESFSIISRTSLTTKWALWPPITSACFWLSLHSCIGNKIHKLERQFLNQNSIKILSRHGGETDKTTPVSLAFSALNKGFIQYLFDQE